MKDVILNSDSYHFYILKTNRTYEVDYLNEPRKTFEIYYMQEEGIAEYTSVHGDKLTLRPGQMLYIPPDTEYRLVVHNNAGKICYGRILCFRFFPDVGHHDFPPQIIKLNNTLLEFLNQVPERSTNVNCFFLFKTYQFLNELLLHLKKSNEKYIKILQPALDYMNAHDQYTIPQLANLCNISESYLYILFKKALGITPIQMKHKLQSSKADLLLKTTDLSIDEIAERVGYSSASHFRKVFHSRFNDSPKEIRKKNRSENNYKNN
ncbi:MAG: AraC family transcriptional regulator [Clostridia bacterium]|nr:AraC family transcriptional regulator [Clostridia bacterium]